MVFSNSDGDTVFLDCSRVTISVQLAAMVTRGDLGEESVVIRMEYMAEARPEP